MDRMSECRGAHGSARAIVPIKMVPLPGGIRGQRNMPWNLCAYRQKGLITAMYLIGSAAVRQESASVQYHDQGAVDGDFTSLYSVLRGAQSRE